LQKRVCYSSGYQILPNCEAVADPVSFLNKRMPKGSELSSIDIEIIVKWHNKGGKSTD